LIFSWQGNFVPDIGAAAAKTTVGNLGRMATAGVPQAERLVIVGCQGMPLVSLTKYFGWLDFMGVVVYIVFVAWYRFNFIPKAALRDDEENITAKDFAVQIDCLPKQLGADQAQYQDKLAMHILGVINEARRKEKNMCTKAEVKVAEVALVRDFGERLCSLKQQADLKLKQDIAAAHLKVAKVFARKGKCFGMVPVKDIIEKNTEKLSQKLQPEPELPVLRAYIILNSPADTARLLTTYRFAHFRLGRLCQSAALRFEGKAIRISTAPEPSNILWANQDVPWGKRLSLRTTMIGIWLVVMCISLVLVYMTQMAAASSGKLGGTQVVGEASCDAGTKAEGYMCDATLAAEWSIAHVRANLTHSQDAVDCFCVTKGYTAILKTKELQDDICKEFIISAGKTTGVGLTASVIVVAINIVLQAMIKVFVELEKHTSVSGKNSALMVKVALSQFLNTGCIIFFLNFNGFGIFNGDYSDFERGWYGIVGAALVMNLLMNSFTGAGVKIVLQLVVIISRWPCFTGKMKHQAELLKVYENPPFDIATRYAQLLTTAFLTLVYSPGLPILNFFAVIYLFLNYWVDKWILLQGSRRPPAYDTQMPKQATEMLLFAAPLHMMMCIFMYSHPCTFPSNALGGSLGGMADQAHGMASQHLNTTGVNTTGGSLVGISDRVTREATWMSFAAFCLTMVFLTTVILKIVVGATFGAVFTACKNVMYSCCCPKSAQVAPSSPVCADGGEMSWDKARNYIENTRPPASYCMENNREFAPLVRFLRSDFAEACASPLRANSSGDDGPVASPAPAATEEVVRVESVEDAPPLEDA